MRMKPDNEQILWPDSRLKVSLAKFNIDPWQKFSAFARPDGIIMLVPIPPNDEDLDVAR